jgi:hypothetical protein
MCLVLTQLIIMPLYKTNRKYNVMKCEHVVLLLCLFVGLHIKIIIMIIMIVCECVYSALELE